MVEMAQLRVVLAEFEGLAVLQTERHAPVRNPDDLSRAAVDQPEAGIVAGPADAVAGPELDVLGPMTSLPPRLPPISSGFQATRPPLPSASSTARPL